MSNAQKAMFAAVPIRAIGDRELTNLDFRVLACIAAHDRMSSVTGKGQGAWASHGNMAERAGCNYARFSACVRKLLERRYLTREPLQGDKRKHTYRVLYGDDDCLPQRKLSAGQVVSPTANKPSKVVCLAADENAQIVCRDQRPTSSDQTRNGFQYIPQSGERNSVETAKGDSAEAAHLTVRDAGDDAYDQAVGAELARLERTFRSHPTQIHHDSALDWLIGVEEEFDLGTSEHGRAKRLGDQITSWLESRAEAAE